MSDQTPDVTVVVIGYNDAARLARAIRSVQTQTLRNLEIVIVDDASTDDTRDVVARIAVDDPRIRYVRLPVNSGGCSAPRNEGVELARAPWVMFCDSDDEFERHACKNLLLAAERLAADVVCGTAERVDIRTGKSRRWKPELHADEVVADGLAQYPDLLSDTISVNKIYRRQLLLDNGIRFPDGLLFEDQLFTLEAMALARRVASIPQTVYRWYVDELSDEPSITQRRNEAANVESRIEVNRRIDAFLAVEGREAIKEIKDLKFLRHDLYLYLAVMLDVDDQTASELMERLRPYVASVNLAPAWQVRTGLRVAIYHLLVGDLEGIRSAMRFVKWASVVDVRIEARGDREYWACEHLDAPLTPGGFATQRWLDVTDLHILTVPYTQRRFLHRLDSLRVEGGGVLASGSSVDYDGSLAAAESIELQFIAGRARLVASVPGTWTSGPGLHRTWRAEGAVTNRLDRDLPIGDHGTIALAVTRGPLQNVVGVRAQMSEATGASVPLPGVSDANLSDLLAVHQAPNGAVGWTATQSEEHQHTLRCRERRSRIPVWGRAVRWWASFRADYLTPSLSRLGTAAPPSNAVIFDTSSVRARHESVRVLSRYLAEHRPELRQAWVHRGRPDLVPDYARPLDRLSFAHRWAAARARSLVDDGTGSLRIRTRKGAEVIYVSDGVPLVRAGLDDPVVVGNSAARRDVVKRARRWTKALVPSRFAADGLVRGHDFRGQVIETGIIRADDLIGLRQEPQRAQRRAALDLDVGRPVIVYAPALRAPRDEPAKPLIDLVAWADALGDRAYLVVAGDLREPIEDVTSLRHAVRVLTAAEFVGDFLAVCDLFVSDYSSLLGDAALLGIPTITFQPDREAFANRAHGMYVDTRSFAPSTRTTAELIATVSMYLAEPQQWIADHGLPLRSFAADHCGPSDGRSAERAVDALWPVDAARAAQGSDS
jgi:CDP-glycerol glycerophosphotransferase